MEGVPGIEAPRLIRPARAAASASILIRIAPKTNTDERMTIRAGACDLFCKSYDPDEFAFLLGILLEKEALGRSS